MTTTSRLQIYSPEPYADAGWCGRCAACAAVRMVPTTECGCPPVSRRKRGHIPGPAFCLTERIGRVGAGPATPSCLHALGRRLAHGFFYRASILEMPRLKVRHVYTQAVGMASRDARRRKAGPDVAPAATLDTALTYHQALALVVGHLGHQVTQGDYSPQTINKMAALMGSLATFMTSGLHQPFVHPTAPAQVAQWVNSATTGKKAKAPSVGLRHNRRSAARLFFRVLRMLDLYEGDPTLDIPLPGRGARPFRPLDDDELIHARYASQTRRGDTRLPAVMALGEACVGSGELGSVLIRDCDLDRGRVWNRGSSRSRPRWGYLSPWGVRQLRARIAELQEAGATEDTPVVYRGTSGGASAQAASCIALNDILELAGLAGEPGVTPMSIAASFARRVYAKYRDIEAVADALGRRDLDSAARMIGHDWHKEPEARADMLAACVLQGESPSSAAGGRAQTTYRRDPSGRRTAKKDSGKKGATAPSRRRRTVPGMNVTRTAAVPR